MMRGVLVSDEQTFDQRIGLTQEEREPCDYGGNSISFRRSSQCKGLKKIKIFGARVKGAKKKW